MRPQERHEAEVCAKIAALPVQHAHAAGIDVGDLTHGVCVEPTPAGSDTVREFPAHTPGRRQRVAWLRCGHTSRTAGPRSDSGYDPGCGRGPEPAGKTAWQGRQLEFARYRLQVVVHLYVH